MTTTKRTKKVAPEAPKATLKVAKVVAPKKPTIKSLQADLDFVTDQLTLANGVALELRKEVEDLRSDALYYANQLGYSEQQKKLAAEERDKLENMSPWEFFKYKVGL